MIYIDLHCGDLGYQEARVEFKFSHEPQSKGPYDIRAYVTIKTHEEEVYELLKQQAKDHITEEIYRYVESEPMGAA